MTENDVAGGRRVSDRRPKSKEHRIRTKDGGTKSLKYSRKKAISLFCVECLGWEVEPRDCTSVMCPLFPFRGKTLSSQRGDHGTVPEKQDNQE